MVSIFLNSFLLNTYSEVKQGDNFGQHP